MTTTKGFKVFNPDWTCRGFQYEVGNTFEENVVPSVCDRGFHFCKEAKDCFNYYNFDPNNKVAEVIALGEVVEDGDKCATNKIQIVREIPWTELLEMVNLGKGNAGLCNSGNRNSGNRNSGNRNSGDCNSGDWNSGDCNSGNRNSGDCNSGNRNSGNRNSGNRNSGDWNSGDCNSGDWNKSSFNVGCFNTEQHKLKFFDKETDMTFEEWRNSDAFYLLNQIDFRPTEWVWADNMTDEEKAAHPEWETTEGYLKLRDNSNACLEWWEGLSETRKGIIRSIPNFDAAKFFEITGIKA
ncbi:hypothetical protein FHR92_003989 [Fontibacillus solani]|uniref:DUF7666 domain-containing protein n=1 Tax=Fontibacillus solani TaxID=1572857 RepID=A0A7W3SWH3_9BACL|nr:hypothetical protein [Fontibacillus solani]MBA9087504.1 hypothetical protein [Fontibacillus solani]